jgi:dihydroneopterin aldolase/2-amino-4-hydroxy-6-hydroxymethyldihydropteridine diphosphokinase
MIELTVLGVGSNLGRRFSNIRNAVKFISQSRNFNLLGASPVYETEPWGYRKQNNFLNCVIAGFYRANPGELSKEIRSLEKKMHRVRVKKWHPRTIDIDILFFDSSVIKAKGLEIPHPQIQYRNFVLKPLSDLNPDFVHPVLKRSVQNLYAGTTDTSGCWLYKRPLLW